jgi:hypothetical protein
MLTEPWHRESVNITNSYGRFHVVRVGLRYHVRERADDGLYRWVGPKPMWSNHQACRVAQALLTVWNNAWTDGKQYGRAFMSLKLTEAA